MNHFIRTMAIVWGFILASCVMGPPISNQDKIAASSFTPPPGRALLYVYRPSSILTVTAPSYCWINHALAGKNGSGTFMAIPLKPGKYTIHAIRHPDQYTGFADEPPIQIDARAGKNYFVRQKIIPTSEGAVLLPTGVVPGFRYEATPIEESTGRAEVAKCRQVGNNVLN